MRGKGRGRTKEGEREDRINCRRQKNTSKLKTETALINVRGMKVEITWNHNQI